MKIATYTDLGPRSVPQEVRRLRHESWDFHRRLGKPVILKHRWNEEDVGAGRAEHCPYCRDQAYQQARDLDPHCFGTGYLGGFEDGVVTFITSGDSMEDIFKINPQGLLMRDRHPICTAPWMPRMYDGDILIEAEFDPETWDVISLGQRFVLKEVTPVEPRGAGGALTTPHRTRNWGAHRQNHAHLVAQNFQMDRLPFEHPLYDVPVEFETPSTPLPIPGPGIDPDDYAPGTIPAYAVVERMIVIHGGGEDVHIVFPNEEGMTTTIYERRDIRITGAL